MEWKTGLSSERACELWGGRDWESMVELKATVVALVVAALSASAVFSGVSNRTLSVSYSENSVHSVFMLANIILVVVVVHLWSRQPPRVLDTRKVEELEEALKSSLEKCAAERQGRIRAQQVHDSPTFLFPPLNTEDSGMGLGLQTRKFLEFPYWVCYFGLYYSERMSHQCKDLIFALRRIKLCFCKIRFKHCKLVSTKNCKNIVLGLLFGLYCSEIMSHQRKDSIFVLRKIKCVSVKDILSSVN